MLNYNPLHCLPSAEDLPDSDYTPVDNELQDLIPNFLKAILAWLWISCMDWFFGVDMGIYYDPELPPIVPDGFLSLGVERVFDENLRLSYVLWEEKLMLFISFLTRAGTLIFIFVFKRFWFTDLHNCSSNTTKIFSWVVKAFTLRIITKNGLDEPQ